MTNAIEIFYFSGTGNSLQVARELQRRLPGTTLVPMVHLLNRDVVKSQASTVGFVFPIHMTTLPMPVKAFIRKLDLSSASYTFAVATRIGITHSAFDGIDSLLKKKHCRLDAAFTLNMPSNDPKFDYRPLPEEESARLETGVLNRLNTIAPILSAQQYSREPDTEYTCKIPFLKPLSLLVTLTERMKDDLYADEKCIGCGVCQRVCLAGKIRMDAGRPTWQDTVKCWHCSACLNFCPVQAAQIRTQTEKNGRYAHPFATIEDIEAQK